MKIISWILILLNMLPMAFYFIGFFQMTKKFCAKIWRIMMHLVQERKWDGSPDGTTEALLLFNMLAFLFWYIRLQGAFRLFYLCNALFGGEFTLDVSFYWNHFGGYLLLISLTFLAGKLMGKSSIDWLATERLVFKVKKK